jgi:hypothetical protein
VDGCLRGADRILHGEYHVFRKPLKIIRLSQVDI